MAIITRETIYYINTRQAYLMNPAYSRRLASRTVLFTAVPDDYLTEARMRDLLGPAIKNIWFPTDTKELDDLVKDRDKAAAKLETAETKLIKAANKERMRKGHSDNDVEGSGDTTADHFIQPKNRPTHRLKPIIGKKVDTIQWARSEIGRLTPLVHEEQEKHRLGKAKLINAVFVEFDNLLEAQAAYQSLTHHQALRMTPKYTGMVPHEVIWSNLRIKGWERFIREAVVIAVVTATVIWWSVPVAFIGSISNLDKWIGEDSPFNSWLGWLNAVPDWIFGVINGLLPAVLLGLLMSLLPVFLRSRFFVLSVFEAVH